jgi:hypothetical protein
MSVEPFLTDPVFPRLGIAGDPESMREVFQEHLTPLGETTYRIRDCRLSRVRYRKGTRCVLQYTLRLTEADTGHERIQWVTGVTYAEDVIQRKWEKLRLLDPGKIPEVFSAFEPYAFIPDLGMLVETFPYDRRLPTLPFVMAGPSPELEPPLLARFGPGNWHTEAWNVEPVRYRAELGTTLRLTLQARDDATGRTDERRFYAKVYHDGEGERTYRVLRTLRSRSGDDGERFTVATPIAYLSGLRTLLQEETPGTPLRDILLHEEDATPAVRKAAGALAALHLDDVSAPRRHPLRNEVAALERTGRLLRWACPHLRGEIEEAVGAVISGLEEVPPAPTHRDLKLDHILLDGGRAALIDLDGFAEADPVLDAANVLAHLAGMRFRFPLVSEDRWWKAAQIFADEYFALVPDAWRDRLPVHYAGAILKVAVGFFRRQEPGWSDKIAILVKEAEDPLAGRVRR